MKQNNTLTQQKINKIEQILSARYRNKDTLTLYSRKEDWFDVMLYRNWSQLKCLGLFSCSVNDTNIEVLSGLDLSNLENLILDDSKIGVNGLAHLLTHNKLPRLKKLNLSQNKLSNQGMTFLLSSQLIFRLEDLALAYNEITYAGLLSMPSLKLDKLTELHLNENNIGSRGVKLITKAQLPLLKNLFLSQCQIGNQGYKNLTKGYWIHLTQLYIIDNKINPISYQMPSSTNWEQLNNVQLNSYDNTQPIGLLGIFATNWTKIEKFNCKFDNDDIKTQYEKLILIKFMKQDQEDQPNNYQFRQANQ